MRHFIYGAMIGMGTLTCLTIHLNWGHPYYVPNDGTSALPIAWFSYDYTSIDHDFLEDVPVPKRKHSVKDDGYTQEQRDFMDRLVAKYNK